MGILMAIVVLQNHMETVLMEMVMGTAMGTVLTPRVMEIALMAIVMEISK
jgi:hypothetical protein